MFTSNTMDLELNYRNSSNRSPSCSTSQPDNDDMVSFDSSKTNGTQKSVSKKKRVSKTATMQAEFEA